MRVFKSAALLLSSIAVAGSSQLSAPTFISKTAIDVKKVLSPPPTPGSDTDQYDFQRILGMQGNRSDAEVARAEFEVDVNLDTFFGPRYGPLTETEVKEWSAFFEQLRIDTNYFVQNAKVLWGRPRPHMANPRVRPAVRLETTNAYPSGHAAISLVFAHTLAMIDPTRTRQFLARAQTIGEDRILAGVHHPSDITAGIVLGDRVFTELRKSPQFRQKVEALRANLERATLNARSRESL
jgi:acid phosphatase (class A)